jgi:hypothetical protein
MDNVEPIRAYVRKLKEDATVVMSSIESVEPRREQPYTLNPLPIRTKARTDKVLPMLIASKVLMLLPNSCMP